MLKPDYIVIIGPMVGWRGLNFPAFMAAERHCQEQWPKAEVSNPALAIIDECDVRESLKFDNTGLAAGLRVQLMPESDHVSLGLTKSEVEEIATADLVVVLPGTLEDVKSTALFRLAEAWGKTTAIMKGEEFEPKVHDPAEDIGQHVLGEAMHHGSEDDPYLRALLGIKDALDRQTTALAGLRR